MTRPSRTPASRLTQVPLFEGLSASQLDRLISISRRQAFAKGDVLFTEGDPALGLFIVLSGRVKVYKLSPDGREQILHVWQKGEPVGEVAVFEGRSYPAHAEALEDCVTLFLSRQGLLDLIRTDPEFALRWLGVLSQRLRRLVGLIESVALREVPARLAEWLLEVDREQGETGMVALTIPKGQLARQLGTIPETLSRTLARLSAQGWIRAEGPGAIRLLDRGALVELASGDRLLTRGAASPPPGAGTPGSPAARKPSGAPTSPRTPSPPRTRTQRGAEAAGT